ncbi:MAG: anthranilate synthase component I family protein [Limnochordales bacterium]|nr:anthranilate synthase component I family protein [Limnochordales bacterium]
MQFRFLPPREEYLKQACSGARVPIAVETLADLETPVSLYLKLRAMTGPTCRGNKATFLLESVSLHGETGRHSFLGAAQQFIEVSGHRLLRWRSGQIVESLASFPPWEALRRSILSERVASISGMPPFIGGAVGYFSYDAVRYIEKIPTLARVEQHVPEILLMLADTVLAFDHFRRTLLAVAAPVVDQDAGRVYDGTVAQLTDLLQQLLTAPLVGPEAPPSEPEPSAAGDEAIGWQSNLSEEEFCRAVETAQRYIREGEIFQVVLSQRFEWAGSAPDSLAFYRALRQRNPSPYLFHLDFGDFQVVGSSPEVMVRLRGRLAELRPIAGTRPRGLTPEEDRRLEAELLADPKERAEHVMLVDLGRNDLGKVCRYGSVRVPEQMVVERYSHVSHIVSLVQGELLPDRDAIDLFCATFPAGTVTGAPKIRAMEIIEMLEPVRRGVYAGAVGYIGFDGNMDTCIAIRTGVFYSGRLFVQTGAGIVYDSVPEREYRETLQKAAALLDTVRELHRQRRGVGVHASAGD